MRKLILIVLMLCAGYYLYLTSFSTIFPPTVAGFRPIALFSNSGPFENGSRMISYKKRYVLNWSDEISYSWSSCTLLTPDLEGYLKEFDLEPKKYPVKYIFVKFENSYESFIEIDDNIIYFTEFPDFGGAGPTDDEKKVCQNSG